MTLRYARGFSFRQHRVTGAVGALTVRDWHRTWPTAPQDLSDSVLGRAAP
ncbi:MAG: hypothetical protein HOQ30_15170 [Gemmatimonadaceae bacterium]|nr:hypothetical protein [Gemmatimonadaceae bacterium]